MAKPFYMQFNGGDWMKDPCVGLCRPATRGVWMDALCAMFELGQAGELVGSVCDLARLCRCTPNEMRAALDDLKARNAAEVTERNGIVTLVNRRMRRDWTGRKSNAERQKKHREREPAGDVRGDANGDVTPEVTPGVTAMSRDIVRDRVISPPTPPPGGGASGAGGGEVGGGNEPLADATGEGPIRMESGGERKWKRDLRARLEAS